MDLGAISEYSPSTLWQLCFQVHAFVVHRQITGMEIHSRSWEGGTWPDFRYGRRVLDVIPWFHSSLHSTRDMQLESRFLNDGRYQRREKTLGNERIRRRMGARSNSGWLQKFFRYVNTYRTSQILLWFLNKNTSRRDFLA